MKVNLKWLQEFVEVDVPVKELVERLNLSGTKVEAIHEPAKPMEGVVVAEVLEIKPHPNADNLTVVEVSPDGGASTRVVCGAKNFAVGDRVPLATVGARLGEMDIQERKIRGETSAGMLCSPAEMKMSSDHSGILVLPPDAPLGHDLVTLLDLDAATLELEITPNRPDCMGMIGIAREVAALLGGELRLPSASVDASPNLASAVEVEVDDPEGCPRYLARYMENVKVTPSPIELAKRLLSAGLRPISNVVDVTNYVMLETAQPLHAFDAAKVHDGKIVVRRTRPGDKLTTLDGLERPLHPDDLLITDPKKPLAFAGILGGEDAEVSAGTTTVILESACFDPTSIAFTSRRHLLRTEASARFERGTDPEVVPYAAARAARLMAQLGQAEVADAAIDQYPVPERPSRITLRPRRTNAVMGLEVPPDRQAASLRSIHLEVREQDGALDVGVPTYRRDLNREVDLIEEVARLTGFGGIPSTLPPGRSGGLEPSQAAERKLKRTLAGLGLHEAWTPAFMGDLDLQALGIGDDHPWRSHLLLANPMTENEKGLRTTLLPGLLRSAGRNVAHRAEGIALFEVARVYVPVEESLPREEPTLGGVFLGQRRPRSWNAAGTTWDFFGAKGILEATFSSMGLAPPAFAPTEELPWHPTRAAQIRIQDTTAGTIGDLHPAVCKRFGVPEGTIGLHLQLRSVFDALPGKPKVQEPPKFPPVFMDLSIELAATTPELAVRDAIRQLGAPELTSVSLFDLYTGDQIAEGQKSLTYALEMRAPDRTLTDEDALRVRRRILEGLEQRLGARLRR